MNTTDPAPLTVLMAVHNGTEYLRPAVESILNQTYRSFRFLIVDDGSTEDVESVVRSYGDPRIDFLRLKRNVGQTAALNIGLREIATPWVARMDGDDVSDLTRLQEQMEIVRRYPDIGCVGTGIWEFRRDPASRETLILRPQDHPEIWQAELLGCGVIHGTLLASREALLTVGGYDERFRYASDRVLLLKLLRRARAFNIQKALVGLRRHSGQDSFSLQAAEEYVKLFTEAIAQEGLSLSETALLRSSLAYAHLFRAGCLRHKGQILPARRDDWRALRLSPRVYARHTLGPIAKKLLPAALSSRFQEKRLGVRMEMGS